MSNVNLFCAFSLQTSNALNTLMLRLYVNCGAQTLRVSGSATDENKVLQLLGLQRLP